MSSRITTGALAGIAGGIVFGMMMQMMSAPTPDGGSMPMMGMVAKVVGSTSLAAGWAYHLFNSAVIGVLFAFAAGNRITGKRKPRQRATHPLGEGDCGFVAQHPCRLGKWQLVTAPMQLRHLCVNGGCRRAWHRPGRNRDWFRPPCQSGVSHSLQS